jgi:hypothetical protein
MFPTAATDDPGVRSIWLDLADVSSRDGRPRMAGLPFAQSDIVCPRHREVHHYAARAAWPYTPTVRLEQTSSLGLKQRHLFARVLTEKIREPLQQKLVQTWGKL